MKKILILGASGRTGKILVDSALDKGYEVTALVRNPDSIQRSHPSLTLVKGSPYELGDLQKAIGTNEAILVALNNPRASDMPWAKPVGPPDVITKSVHNALTVMQANSVSRLVVLSAFGVGDSFDLNPWLTRFFIRNTNLNVAYQDHEATEKLLRTSTVNWTTVRPVALSDKTAIKPVAVSYTEKLSLSASISRKAVAEFMLDSLENPAYFGKTPTISEA